MRTLKLCLLITVFLLSGCKDEALLNNLDQNQANEVMALLQKNNIAATKRNMAKAGYSVFVDMRDFSAAVDLMAIYNLPSRPRVEVAEMFPADSLISSPRAEVARIYSAIEQRLEQTLNQMNGIISSRVHVSYDVSNTDAEKQGKPMHVAVLLRYDTAIPAEGNLLNDATRLVKNSFANIDYENISVVMTPAPRAWPLPPVEIKQYEASSWGDLFIAIIFVMMIISGVMFAVQKKYRKT